MTSTTISDQQVLTNLRAENYIRQGVTTIVVGNCGRSAVPTEKYPTFTKYFSRIERQGISVNLVALIGHGSLREYVIGSVERPLAPDEMSRMKQLAGQLLRDGASGMSRAGIAAFTAVATCSPFPGTRRLCQIDPHQRRSVWWRPESSWARAFSGGLPGFMSSSVLAFCGHGAV